jgi:hypothetical protein
MPTKTLLLFFLTSISSLLPHACKRDPFNCKDDKVGDVYLSEESKAFFPAITDPKIRFENEQGGSKEYVVITTKSRIPLHVKKLCEGLDLSTHYEFMDGDKIEYKLLAPSDSFLINVTMLSAALVSRKDTVFYDFLDLTHFENMSGSSMGLVASKRGQITVDSTIIQTAVWVGDTIVHGKSFSGVYKGVLFGGANPADKQNVYIAKSKGMIGFRDNVGIFWLKK